MEKLSQKVKAPKRQGRASKVDYSILKDANIGDQFILSAEAGDFKAGINRANKCNSVKSNAAKAGVVVKAFPHPEKSDAIVIEKVADK